MEKLNLSQYQNTIKARAKKSPNHKYAWQVTAQEISDYFKKPLYFLFYKYPEFQILNAYKWCKEKNISRYQILISLLKK